MNAKTLINVFQRMFKTNPFFELIQEIEIDDFHCVFQCFSTSERIPNPSTFGINSKNSKKRVSKSQKKVSEKMSDNLFLWRF